MLISRAVLAALSLAVTVLPAAAATPDCSAMKIADTPLKGTVRGKPFVPNEITIHKTANGFGMDKNNFDSYELSIQSGGIFNAATMHFLVRSGTKPDGRTFRVLPIDSIGGQPAAMTGVPEVQGWDLELEAADVDTSFTEDTASIRLEIGKQAGDKLPAHIAFCVPSVNATITGAFSARVIP